METVWWTVTQLQNGLVREGYSREVKYKLRGEGWIQINQKYWGKRVLGLIDDSVLYPSDLLTHGIIDYGNVFITNCLRCQFIFPMIYLSK